ncbi:MAG: Crp/Fnr family transcriptional regulator [Spirochaetes bacterium]|nr:Crp/Fnr family transcriptional regulator [Spirochaetota bacterium]MBN2771954.1 Crp/Fnr family transcriptional regulator [Spirochaetota bacterium]
MKNEILYKKFKTLLESKWPAVSSCWKQIRDSFEIEEYIKNDILLREGERDDRVFFIVTGGVRHYCIDIDGKEQTTDFCVEGEFSGTFNFEMSNIPLSEQWIAVFEKSIIATAEKQKITGLLTSDTVLMQIFNDIIASYYKVKLIREKYLLMSDLDSRYSCFEANHSSLVNRVPFYQIASFLGMTPETLSRIRTRSGCRY